MTLPHLLVVDAQSLAGRAAHVAAGDVTNGVRLWCQMARGAAMEIAATHVVEAWDHEGPTFQHALFPTYKHRRTGSMRARITPIREGVEGTGIASVSVAPFEGDDSVASLMARFRSEARVTLLSNDSTCCSSCRREWMLPPTWAQGKARMERASSLGARPTCSPSSACSLPTCRR